MYKRDGSGGGSDFLCSTQIDKLLEMESKRRCPFDSQEEFDKGKDTRGELQFGIIHDFCREKCTIIALLPN